MVEQDYYELLGVPRGADDAAIKAAYRKLAKECHPDRHNGCSEQEAQFKAINEAYDVLKDPQKRAAYDRFGKAAFQNGGGGDPFARSRLQRLLRHFLDHLRRVHGPARRTQNAARGADLRYDLELSLEEAFTGVEKTITVQAMATCEPCHGRGCTKAERLREHLPDLRRHGQGPRAAGLLRRRARLPDLPRLAAKSSPIRARTATARAARSPSASCR